MSARAFRSAVSTKEVTMEFEAVLRRVRSEFMEMPGLRLTPAQARRLWGVEREVCHAIIDALIDSAFLRWTPAGALVRSES
jgi:hypothetical protein